MATLKELLGDAYNEGMTYAEVETAINSKNLVDLSSGNYVSKSKYDAAIGERDDFKSKYNATLTDAQKAEQEAKEREERYKAIEKENAIHRYTDKLGSTIKDKTVLTEVATLMADGKFDEAIDKQNTYLATEATAMEQRIKDELMKKNPQASAQNGSGGAITKEEFTNMGLAERTKLYREQPEIYKQLNEQ
jgi:hypothetical protein